VYLNAANPHALAAGKDSYLGPYGYCSGERGSGNDDSMSLQHEGTINGQAKESGWSRALDGAGLKEAIGGRIQALASVHELFVQSRWTGADVHRLVEQELSPYCEKGTTRAQINGPNLVLAPDVAQTVAVTLHELATNAAKFGALSTHDGCVQVEWWCTANGRLVLRWRESGGPAVMPPTRQGFGTRVIDRMVRGQLKGQMLFDWRPEGLACEITVQT
jgi:two-component sensor histidine kinase